MLQKFRDAMIKEYTELILFIDPYNEEDNADEALYAKASELIIDGFLKTENRDKYSAADIIQPVFKELKGVALRPESCADAVSDLIELFDTCTDTLMFMQDEDIGNMIEDGYTTPVIKINEHFTLDYFFLGRQGYIYINELFYRRCPKRKVLELYKKIINDEDTIYVEYDYGEELSLGNIFKSPIKTYKRRKYDYAKVKNKDRVKRIFNINGLV